MVSRLALIQDAALEEVEEKESNESIEQVFRELDRDASAYPAEPLEGQWI